METTMDAAYKFGCGRYVQEPGALSRIGEEAARFSKSVFIVSGETARALTERAVAGALQSANVAAVWQTHTGACCEESARAYAAAARAAGCGAIAGIGGGRALDLAKLTARLSGLPVICAPTTSATCAAFSPLSVVYTPEGRTRGTWLFPLEVGAVLADMDILFDQPPRFLAAGILDAMAKWIEVSHHLRRRTAGEGADAQMAALIARHVYERLTVLAPEAYADICAGRRTQAVWDAVYLSIAGAGMVSGAARGQYQSALAHAAYEAVRTRFTLEAQGAMHGEIVAVALFWQLRFNGMEELEAPLAALMQGMRMPLTLPELGIADTRENREALWSDLASTRFVHAADGPRLSAAMEV